MDVFRSFYSLVFVLGLLVMLNTIVLSKQGYTDSCTYTKDIGVVKSVNYPCRYPSDTNVNYTINVSLPDVVSISLTFKYFHLQEREANGSCSNDYLIINGSKMCGWYNGPPQTYNGSVIVMRFHSDNSMNEKCLKFNIDYKANLHHSSTGTLTSTHINERSCDSSCYWTTTVDVNTAFWRISTKTTSTVGATEKTHHSSKPGNSAIDLKTTSGVVTSQKGRSTSFPSFGKTDYSSLAPTLTSNEAFSTNGVSTGTAGHTMTENFASDLTTTQTVVPSEATGYQLTGSVTNGLISASSAIAFETITQRSTARETPYLSTVENLTRELSTVTGVVTTESTVLSSSTHIDEKRRHTTDSSTVLPYTDGEIALYVLLAILSLLALIMASIFVYKWKRRANSIDYVRATNTDVPPHEPLDSVQPQPSGSVLPPVGITSTPPNKTRQSKKVLPPEDIKPHKPLDFATLQTSGSVLPPIGHTSSLPNKSRLTDLQLHKPLDFVASKPSRSALPPIDIISTPSNENRLSKKTLPPIQKASLAFNLSDDGKHENNLKPESVI